MALLPQIKTATLKTNVNLRTTVNTQQNIGQTTMVSQDSEARVMGIPGASGTDGADGQDGIGNLMWQGEFVYGTSYRKDDLVNFNGTTFIYINDTIGLQEIPSTDTAIWNIFTGEPEMRVEIDELPDGNMYVGKTLPDALDNELKWSIKKVLFIGNDISIIWADNESTYNKAWNLRNTYFP